MAANKDGKTTKKKRLGPPRLSRSEKNPIISPKKENTWENWQTFNPGAILIKGKIYIIYRAVGDDGLSRLGYAASKDGITIDERLPFPVYAHKPSKSNFNYCSFASGGSFGGVEDPRLVRVENEDTIYMTYTACDEGPRIGLTSIKVDDFLQKKWKWKSPEIISAPDEVHKNWVIFPQKIKGKYAILHSLCPELLIDYRDSLKFKKGEFIKSCYNGTNPLKNCWDDWLRGAGAPPIKTRLGWLLFYHAMSVKDPGNYKVGAMILDLKNPNKILYRAKEPVFEPKADYENNGFKSGVVYVTGAIVKKGKIFVYYGASDTHVGVATADLEGFLEALTQSAEPKLNSKKQEI